MVRNSPRYHSIELTDEIKLSDSIHPEKKRPVEVNLSLNEKCLILIPKFLQIAVFALGIVSGAVIIVGYSSLLFGHMPDTLEKMTLDYSITIFVGCSIYLFTYSVKAKDMLKELLGVKEMPQLKP